MCHWSSYKETHSSLFFIEMKLGIVYPHFLNLFSYIVPVRIFKGIRMFWHQMAWAMHFVPSWGEIIYRMTVCAGMIGTVWSVWKECLLVHGRTGLHLDVTRTKVPCWGGLKPTQPFGVLEQYTKWRIFLSVWFIMS